MASDRTEFYKEVIRISKQILLASKNLKEMVFDDQKEEATKKSEVTDAAREAAKITSHLMDLVKSNMCKPSETSLVSKEELDNQKTLRSASSTVCNKVLDLVESAKSCINNPYDFLTKQKLQAASEEVVSSIKQMLAASESLRGGEDKKMKDDAKAAHNDVVRLVEVVSQSGGHEEFIAAAKRCARSLSRMIEVAGGMKLPDLPDQLNHLTRQLVAAAREAYHSPLESDARKSLEKLRAQVLQKLDQLVAAAYPQQAPPPAAAAAISSTPPVAASPAVQRAAPPATAPIKSTASPARASSRSAGGGKSPSQPVLKAPLLPAEDVSEGLLKVADDVIALLAGHLRSMQTEWMALGPDQQDELRRQVGAYIKRSGGGEGADQDRAESELSNFLSAPNFSEWRRTVRMSTMSKRPSLMDFMKAAPPEGTVAEIQHQLHDAALELIISSNGCCLEAHVSDHRTACDSVTTDLFNILKKAVTESTRGNPGMTTIEKIIISTMECLDREHKLAGEHQVDENVLKAAVGQARGLIVFNMRQKMWQNTNSFRVLAVIMMAALNSINQNKGGIVPQSSLLQVASTCKALALAINELLKTMNTLARLLSEEGEEGSKMIDAMVDDIFDVNIWKEKSGAKKDQYSWADEKPAKVNIGTLNKLVEALTSDVKLDPKFMKTFIVTHRSFTTPWRLFEKLLQRYAVPANTVGEARAKAIQMRVCVTLKYWLENQFNDFDDNLIKRVKNFIDNTLKVDGHVELSTGLHQVLEQKVAHRSQIYNTMFNVPPTDLSIPPSTLSPSDLFLAFNDEEIARQLTVKLYQIYSSIEPSELLNQSWNKAELNHRAPHVLQLVNGLNKLSFWVPSLILWQDKLKDRANMVIKFLTIAQHLLNMNNYNTLMGIVAGLNLSAVSRLKFTFEEVKRQQPKLLEKFKTIETLMSPQGSFKNFRNALHKSKCPAIPYLGVYLGDLTFMEDGNPDTIDDAINFKKRKLVYKQIAEMSFYQLEPYNFPLVEPIYTFLSELPHQEEKELFELSLQREPRNAQAKDIS
mmetsp:Transcript_17426/g.44379  ORF Transcript_17426/g.44379 Transcript_17426/m.44379 type:complete len:1036 (-) Transcript_17426:126-3233(-)|eukprot:CAMPEP_0177643882 /NCGR_PEP_ID=MMETSP0447-20121125/8386_1 /TAXON_ID=0 /ORGANISM="Stygamoeba regulata, Strain BSH-02190019" /LENGTH=1035 /DNA_ID=CAMNT_0019146195 /DNA_START=193 /DNA_END=3300 /DNA_ORIENTATION=+